MDTLEAHIGHTTGDNIESSREHNDVEVTMLAIPADAILSEFLYWCGLDVDNISRVLVQDFVVVLFEAWTVVIGMLAFVATI